MIAPIRLEFTYLAHPLNLQMKIVKDKLVRFQVGGCPTQFYPYDSTTVNGACMSPHIVLLCPAQSALRTSLTLTINNIDANADTSTRTRTRTGTLTRSHFAPRICGSLTRVGTTIRLPLRAMLTSSISRSQSTLTAVRLGRQPAHALHDSFSVANRSSVSGGSTTTTTTPLLQLPMATIDNIHINADTRHGKHTTAKLRDAEHPPRLACTAHSAPGTI